MAGAEGFEPSNAGTKTQCLTAWRRPIEINSFAETAELNLTTVYSQVKLFEKNFKKS